MNKENINEFENFKQQFFMIMDFLKQYLGVISTGIIFTSFTLGVLILTWYYVFTINFIPDLSKDLIIANIFLVSWMGFIFIIFFVVLYIMPLIYFKEILNDVSGINTWQNVRFVFLPMILSSIGAFLIICFLDDIASFFPNLESFIIRNIVPIFPFVVASLFLFGIKKFFKKDFILKAILFFFILCILFFSFCLIIVFFEIEEIYISVLICVIYYIIIFVVYLSIYKKYNFYKVLLTSTIPAFILAVIILNPYIVRISKIGNYNQSFMLYNKSEVKELLDLYHIPIFKENNATLIVKDLHVLSNVGESYLIKNDENNSFSLDKKSVFSILIPKN